MRSGRSWGALILIACLSSTTLAQVVHRLDTSPGFNPDAILPQIAASGASVFVTWTEARSGVANIHFNHSFDGGSTWLDSAIRLNTNSPDTAASSGPDIAISGDGVFVVWQDGRIDKRDIFFSRSEDGGSSWLTKEIRLNTNPAGTSFAGAPQVAAVGDAIYVAWLDSRNGGTQAGPYDVYFNRSLDRGITWLPADLRLDTTVPGTADSREVRVCAVNDSVYVIWRDDRNGLSDIFLNRSLDAGLSWMSSEERLNSSPPGVSECLSPRIHADGSAVYVTWGESRSGAADIFFNRSLDQGNSWLMADRRLDTDPPGRTRSFWPRITVSGNTVYVVWSDTGSDDNGSFLNRSTDHGATWQQSNTKISEGNRPRVAANGDKVFVAWNERRGIAVPTSGIYFNRSLDRGKTWMPVDHEVEKDGDRYSSPISMEMLASGDSVYVTWDNDKSAGPFRIYFSIPFGSQPFGDGSPGSGNAVPKLEGNDSLNIGSTFTLSISNALGGAFGLLALGGPASKTSIPLAGGNLLIDPIDLIVPIKLEGPLNAPGAGTLSIDCPIPDEPALLGFNINMQALIIDPGSATGVAWTNGVEAWIL